MKTTFSIATPVLISLGLLPIPALAEDQNEKTAAPAPEKVFQLAEIDGRNYLIKPNGERFRSLGINHLGSATGKPDDIIQQLRNWGFNAGGSYNPDWLMEVFPHPQAVNLLQTSSYRQGKSFYYEDVFDPEFQKKTEEKIKAICLEYRSWPHLIGYYWTDYPIWARRKRDQPSWIEFFQSLPQDAPGRQAWQAWRSENPNAPEDDFLGEIAKTLYATAYRSFKKHDPQRLILGDRYRESDMPEAVIRAALPYIDIISLQPTTREFDPTFYHELYNRYGKPIYISDHVGGFSTPEYPKTISRWTHDTPEEYVDYYETFVTAALSHPRLIGYTRCQFQSIPRANRPDTQKQGLLRMDGTPYEIVDRVAEANKKALAKAMGEDDNESKPQD